MSSNWKTLLIAGIGLVLLPFVLPLIGLTMTAATMVVALGIAVLGLNLLMGYTGLVSFGHAAWFGIGAYAAALIQKTFLPGHFILPLLGSILVTALLSLVVGALILRRRGVYFSLLTLAFTALTFTVAFRWTALTGGEDGLGGFSRGGIGPLDLADNAVYYAVVALSGFGVLYVMLRLVHSPFGTVLQAIRENTLRAEFQGYNVQRYKLIAYVVSAAVTGLGGALSGFLHYIVTAESSSIEMSGELMAMVVIGGMHAHILGPIVGVLFFLLFREMISIATPDWMFWFGLIFVGFVMYLPGGLVGLGGKLWRIWRPLPEESAAMSRRRIHEGLDLPETLRPTPSIGEILAVKDVSINFGGIKAVQGASLKVRPGEIHVLIGPNGAGKTTLFNLISGRFRPKSGTVRLMGREIQGLAPQQICHAGLSRSFQITSLFDGLSIGENLRLSGQAKHPARYGLWRNARSLAEVEQDTAALIRFLGLEGIEDVRAGDLSYGGQRLVDLGIALASKPRVILLDEPLAGLAAAERERVGRLIVAMARHIPVLIVEHDIDRVLSFCQEVTVMNEGEVLINGSPAEIRANAKVQEIYTGTGTPAVTGRSQNRDAAGKIVLRAEGLHTFYGKSHILNGASIEARQGEIVALLGRNGAGKSTFLKTIAGIVKPTEGRLSLRGQDVTGISAWEMARAGVGYVPQGRGVFAGMTVRDNLALGRLGRATDGETGTVWSEEKIFDFFPRLAERINSHADYLSGGEQQMLAVARALSGNVSLLLLDEPFEGLAPAVVEDLFRVFDRLRQDVPIVIVEHNLDLVLALADRVFALENGQVFHEGPAQALLCDMPYRKKVLWL
ncbi:branched-chain amino acid ABC transporter ATP-binding protein/permease [Paracoccus sp. MBLB3053]|uniref:Branched-chain amino acid ABC transporter ATP-binding protein/permease n=1 Tax=Paracoccus aurantius TaxID=3073814 RepID=A0ABU2HXN9_9RHOB|nr:branched-chain amino acid ABC transporter ATP-binding protein/permease [Paracoccus sp. MBLB3053]MDS9469829.1 branched-chain amino acid ABC transporter ATP-binding protein/permease [Paracoccus sp. MBLB3053]